MGKIQLDFKEFKELLKMGLIKHKTKRGKNGKKTKYVSRKEAIKAIKKAYEMGGEKSGSSHMVVPMNNVGNTLAMESQRLANEKLQNSINDDKQKQLLSRFNDPTSTQLTLLDNKASEQNRFDAVYQNNPTLQYNDFLHNTHYRNFDELNNKIDRLNDNYFNAKGNSKFAQYEENENDKDNIVFLATPKKTTPQIEEIDDNDPQIEDGYYPKIEDIELPQIGDIYTNDEKTDDSIFFGTPNLNDEILQREDLHIRPPPMKHNNLTSEFNLYNKPNILLQSDEGSNRSKKAEPEPMIAEDVNSDDENEVVPTVDPKNNLTHKMMMNVIMGYNKKNPNSKIKYTKNVNGKAKQFNTDELLEVLKDYGLL